jgi:hypothetical protein
VRSAGLIGLVALLALPLASCAHTSAERPSQRRRTVTEGPPAGPSTTDRVRARIPSAQPIAMTETPRALLIFCRGNPLLRPICPRRIPAWGSARPDANAQGYSCIDRNGKQPVGGRALLKLFTSRRCVDAVWSFEDGKFLPLLTPGHRVSAWDGTAWFAPAFAAMDPPPWHVHVEIEASLGSLPAAGGPPLRAEGAHRVTDALLNPKHRRAVSLGWVRWYGRYGQLVLAPTNVNGGEWAGHLIFYFTTGHVGYAITLHAWASRERFTGGGLNRVVRFEAGPALPRVVASLKSIVGSALRR